MRFTLAIASAALVAACSGKGPSSTAAAPSAPSVPGSDAPPPAANPPPVTNPPGATPPGPTPPGTAIPPPSTNPLPASLSLGAWEWLNPLPQGNPVNAIWAGAADDVWAAGDGGALLHFDGGSWSRAQVDVRAAMRAVWGSSASDVWAVGDRGTLLHFDGATWQRVAAPVSAALLDVRGNSATDVWASGEAGTLLHYDGSAWTLLPAPTSLDLNAVWPFPSGEVWLAAGGPIFNDDGAVLHGDGVHWVTEKPGSFRNNALALWATSATDIWVDVREDVVHWDGAAWTDHPLGDACFVSYPHALWASAPNDVWAGCSGATVQHFDGTAWTSVPESEAGPFVHVLGGADAAHLWGGADTGALVDVRHGAFAADFSNLWGNTAANLFAVWGTAADDVWVGGQFTAVPLQARRFHAMLAHFDGQRLTQVDLPGMDIVSVIGGSGADDVWMSGLPLDGQCSTFHFDGESWRPVAELCAAGVGRVIVGGPRDVWLVSWNAVHHWDGTTLTPASAVPKALVANQSGTIWSWGYDPIYDDVSRTELYDLGFVGSLQPDGTTAVDFSWDEEFVPYAVWGATDDDVWAIGFFNSRTPPYARAPALLHRSAVGWSQVRTELPGSLRGLVAKSASDIWAFGDAGALMHYDGQSWTIENTGTRRGLYGLFELPTGEVVVVGEAGTVLRRAVR